MQNNKEITEAIVSWNELFSWTAKRCKTVEEGVHIFVLLDKILKILKEHPGYGDIGKDYEGAWKLLIADTRNTYDTNN